MILDLSEIIKNYGGVKKIDCEVDLSEIDFMGEDFKFSAPLKVSGEIRNNTKSLELDATVSGSMQVHCARCAKPFNTNISYNLSEILVREDTEIGEDADVVVFSGHEVDLSELVADGFFMNVSGRYLCREDCKGLCPVCGCDLNEQSCNCQKEYIDPRWAGLADIMKDTTTE